MSVRIGSIKIVHPRREVPPQDGFIVKNEYFKSTSRKEGRQLIDNLSTLKRMNVGIERTLRSQLSYLFINGVERGKDERDDVSQSIIEIFGKKIDFNAIKAFLRSAKVGDKKVLGESFARSTPQDTWGRWDEIKSTGFLEKVAPQEKKGCKAVIGISSLTTSKYCSLGLFGDEA